MAPTDGVDYPGMLPPPPGVTPNFTNPDSMAWRLIVASVLCPVFATLFCLLRFYTARFVVRKIFRDDCKFPLRACLSWLSLEADID